MKIIDTSDGYEVLVDDEDYERLRHWSWSVNNAGYANSGLGFMHHAVLNTKEEVHHVNSDKLDNRRSNLRITTHTNNLLSITQPQKNNKIGKRGVVKKKGRFYAYVVLDGKQKWPGGFATAEDANAAYEDAKAEVIW